MDLTYKNVRQLSFYVGPDPPNKHRLKERYLQHYRNKLHIYNQTLVRPVPHSQALQLNGPQVNALIKLGKVLSPLQGIRIGNLSAPRKRPGSSLVQVRMSDGELLRTSKFAKKAQLQFSKSNRQDQPNKTHKTKLRLGFFSQRCLPQESQRFTVASKEVAVLSELPLDESVSQIQQLSRTLSRFRSKFSDKQEQFGRTR